MTSKILQLKNVSKKYGEFLAVDNVSFAVDEKGITALIGPNGAGKTTLYNTITGKTEPTEGTIVFQGEDITSYNATERVHLGMGRSFQLTTIFEGLSARENILGPILARSDDRWNPLDSVRRNEPLQQKTDEILDMVGLRDVVDGPSSTLPYGDRRRIEIGIALATDPDLMLLDEPTAGLTYQETIEMMDLIERLNDQTATTFFIIEHDMNLVFGLADRILVLNRGRIIADGTPEEIQSNETVQTAYLGRRHGETDDLSVSKRRDVANTTATSRDSVLSITDIDTYYGDSHVLHDVSLEVHRGEIVALLGRNGAGKTTTLRSIIGLTPPRDGRIEFLGQRIDGLKPNEISKQGIGYVPEERDIFADLTVRENLEVAMADDSDWTFERVLNIFPVLEDYLQKPGTQLSGGEQQMLSIARALVTDPQLLLLDEPSEGLAPVIIDDLEDVLTEIADEGITVLLTEQNTPFAAAISNRCYVLDNGAVGWDGTPAELLEDDEIVGKYLTLSEVSPN